VPHDDSSRTSPRATAARVSDSVALANKRVPVTTARPCGASITKAPPVCATSKSASPRTSRTRRSPRSMISAPRLSTMLVPSSIAKTIGEAPVLSCTIERSRPNARPSTIEAAIATAAKNPCCRRIFGQGELGSNARRFCSSVARIFARASGRICGGCARATSFAMLSSLFTTPPLRLDGSSRTFRGTRGARVREAISRRPRRRRDRARDRREIRRSRICAGGSSRTNPEDLRS